MIERKSQMRLKRNAVGELEGGESNEGQERDVVKTTIVCGLKFSSR